MRKERQRVQRDDTNDFNNVMCDKLLILCYEQVLPETSFRPNRSFFLLS